MIYFMVISDVFDTTLETSFPIRHYFVFMSQYSKYYDSSRRSSSKRYETDRYENSYEHKRYHTDRKSYLSSNSSSSHLSRENRNYIPYHYRPASSINSLPESLRMEWIGHKEEEIAKWHDTVQRIRKEEDLAFFEERKARFAYDMAVHDVEKYDLVLHWMKERFASLKANLG
jgi:hypothetical protein